jgi:hypothetical protein
MADGSFNYSITPCFRRLLTSHFKIWAIGKIYKPDTVKKGTWLFTFRPICTEPCENITNRPGCDLGGETGNGK